MSSVQRLNLVERLKALVTGRILHGQPSYWSVGFLPASLGEATRKAGDTWTNSVVASAISWISWNVNEGRLRILRGDEEVARPLPTLDPPNDYMPLSTMLTPTILSLVVSGNAYWAPDTSEGGRPVRWYWVPHWLMRPFRSDPHELVSGYVYDTGSSRQIFKRDDVCHFRMGVDPRDTMRGLSPLASVLREVVTDNDAGYFAQAIMANYGVMSGILTPKDGPISIEEAERVRREINQRFAGEGRGSILVGTGQMEFTSIAQKPNELSIDALRDVPEERICSVIGVPAMLLHLGSGAKHATYSNLQEARRTAWESTVLPMQGLIADTLTRILRVHGLLPDRERLDFDNCDVSALREDQDALWKRVTEAWRTGLISRVLAHQLLDLDTEGVPDEYAVFGRGDPMQTRTLNYRRYMEEHFGEHLVSQNNGSA